MIQSSGQQRDYILHVPTAYDPNVPQRLMFIFHGLTVEPSRIAYSWSWNGFQYRAGANTIFVAPRGQQGPGGLGWADAANSIQLVRDLLAEIRSSFCVDDARIFSTGSSYGGIMSNRVGCALGDVFRAIAPIMGNGPAQYGPASCVGEVAAWITHGRNDFTVPFATGEASRDYWAAANGCDGTTFPIGPDECVEYAGCDPALPVVWCPTNNGHQDPPYAAEAIWAFFSRF